MSLWLLWAAAAFWAGALARVTFLPGAGARDRHWRIVVENFDVNYLVFERAAELRRKGRDGRIVVAGQASPDRR